MKGFWAFLKSVFRVEVLVFCGLGLLLVASFAVLIFSGNETAIQAAREVIPTLLMIFAVLVGFTMARNL